MQEKEQYDRAHEIASILLEMNGGAGASDFHEREVRAHQSQLARKYREGLGRRNTPRALVQEQVEAGSGANANTSASLPEPKSRTYENYPVGGWAMDDERYMFKNCFAGAKKRKRLSRLEIPLALLFLVWSSASLLLGLTQFDMNTASLLALSMANIGLCLFVAIGLTHRTKTRIGTFVCEFSTTVKDGKTQRRFKCLDLRGARPETVAMGPYAPEDLELRGAMCNRVSDFPDWAELRLNVSGAASHEPETIVLLGAPTLAHGVDPRDVVEIAHDMLAHQGIEIQSIKIDMRG